MSPVLSKIALGLALVCTAFTNAFAADKDKVTAVQIFSCDIPVEAKKDGLRKVDVFLRDFKTNNAFMSMTGIYNNKEMGVLLDAQLSPQDDGSAVITAELLDSDKVVLTIKGEPNFGKIASATVVDPFADMEFAANCRVMSASLH